MSVGEERDLPARGQRAFDDRVGAGGNLFDRFPVEDAIVPYRPTGPLGADLGGGSAVVAAVVPFGEVVVGLRDVAVAGDAAGLFGALARASEHEREWTAVEVIMNLFSARVT